MPAMGAAIETNKATGAVRKRRGEVVLYHYPLSYGSQIVRLALAEKGVAWRGWVVDIGPVHENYAPWYMRLNPRGVVPTLQHGNRIVTETVEICRYIDAVFPGPRLIPETKEERNRVEEWIGLVGTFPERELAYGVLGGIPGAFRRADLRRRKRVLKQLAAAHPELRDLYAAKYKDVVEWERAVNDPSWVDGVLSDAETLLGRLEVRLADREWILGARYSLADVVWTAFLARLEMLGLSHMWAETERPAVAAYYARLRARPSFRAAPVFRREALSVVIPSLLRAFGVRIALVLALLGGLAYGVYAVLWRLVAGSA